VANHRDSPGIDPDEPEVDRSTPHRRFARLVQSSAARRVALPRLILAGGIAVGFVFLVAFAGSKILGSIRDWVASRPDQQLAFSDIELIPEPPPWLIGGRSTILAQVRDEAKLGGSLPLLNLDLDALRKDFRRSPWVKDVSLVRLDHGRLAVHLAYRKPVAAILLGNVGYVVDDEAVLLQDTDIAWKLKKPRFQILGNPEPLIEIQNVQSSAPPKVGLRWKGMGAEDTFDAADADPMVLGAARLAAFLQGRAEADPPSFKLLNFESIYLPEEPVNTFFLVDVGKNVVGWGDAPGDHKPTEPSAMERWEMLLARVRRHGPLNAKYPNYIRLGRAGAELVQGMPRKKMSTSPR
jgi:hypothetical protein